MLSPGDISKIVNGLLSDAKLRLHTRGEWQESKNTFRNNQSQISLVGVTRPTPVPEARMEK